MAMPRVERSRIVEVADVPADKVDETRQALRNQGATLVELIAQPHGVFTLRATFADEPDASDAEEMDSGLPGDPDFPTDRE
jgi:hypothetical protein